MNRSSIVLLLRSTTFRLLSMPRSAIAEPPPASSMVKAPVPVIYSRTPAPSVTTAAVTSVIFAVMSAASWLRVVAEV